MKITCPSCSAKYSIADEKVADRLAKIRCRKCGTTIVIDGKVDPANVYAADAAPEAGPGPASAGGAAAGEYSVDFGDNDQRNMTLDQLVTSYNAGEVTAETYIWTEGMDDWRPLGEVDDVVNALHAASSESGGSAPMVSAPSSPFDTGASASPWANDSAPKAAASAGTADLFGGFDSAGSEEDVTTSAPEETRGPVAAAATGARNESSVLFSLSALTSAAEKQPEPLGGMAASSGSTKEDSGLIDLKALTSQASSDQPADNPLMGSSPLGFGAPLGLGSPLAGGIEASVPASASMAPQPKSRSGLYIGGGIALAAIVIAGAIVFASGGSKETGAAAQPEGTTTAAATTAAPTPEPAPTPTVTAEAPATGTATAEEPAPSAEPVAAAPKPANYGKPLPKPAATAAKPAATSAPAAPKPTATAAPKPTAKPAAKTCKCPPGDLMCAMRCRAG